MDAAQAAQETGIPYTTLCRWIRQGMVQPEGYVGRQGRQIPLGPKELRELRILARLRETFSFQELRAAADFLRRRGDNPYSSGSFAIVRGAPGRRRLLKVCSGGEVLEIIGRERGQLQLIPLGEDVTEDLREKVPDLEVAHK